MKRVRATLAEVAAFPNLLQAVQRASSGKRFRPDVLRFNATREERIHALSVALGTGSWTSSPHRHFHIRDPKPRWISAAPFADRVVHHAVCNVIGPPLERRLIDDCWANRAGFGSHRAVLRFQQFAGRHGWVLKADIRKYFASVDRSILLAQLTRLLKDPLLLALLERIIRSAAQPDPDIRRASDGSGGAHGLPIGNLTSQLWANTYLDDFDHWVRESLRCGAYLRFVDDFALFSDDPDQLRCWRQAIAVRLGQLNLSLHERKTVVRRTGEGTPFLGYVIWPTRIRVRGSSLRRFRRQSRRVEAERRAARSVAWRGHTALAGDWRRRRLSQRTHHA